MEDEPRILDASFSQMSSGSILQVMLSLRILIWSAENPHAAHETPHHPDKTGVCYAVSSRRIVGPMNSTDNF